MNDTTSPYLADGSEPLIGARVQRVYPQDGKARAGKRHGPTLVISALKDYSHNGAFHAKALATLKEAKTKKPAGVEPIWNLRRAAGHQPKAGEPDMRSLPRRTVKGDVPGMKGMVSSIRIGTDLRERLASRGDEISAIMRRDLVRLYDLLDETRDRLRFPPGTLAVLADAWQYAAPPPQETLRPQYFVPVLLNACARLGTDKASVLAAYVRKWHAADALAVLDVVERFTPEESAAEKFARLGLREAPPDDEGSPETGAKGRK